MAETKQKPLKAIKESQTKTQVLASIAEETGLTKKQVGEVVTSLANHAKRHLMARGSGEFSVPELGLKLRRVKKPAQKARKGRNPATGEEIMIKAKPARNVLRATPLKALKSVI